MEFNSAIRTPAGEAMMKDGPKASLVAKVGGTLAALEQCANIATMIQEKLEGPVPSTNVPGINTPGSLSEATLELSNRAVRLLNMLEAINGSLS